MLAAQERYWPLKARSENGNENGSSPQTPSSLIMQLRDVGKIYKTGAGGFAAVSGVDLDIQRGEFLGIVGKSGAGKTTLLNLISGVSRISSGKITYFPLPGERANGSAGPLSIGEMTQDQLAAWRGVNMGIVYQSFELMPQLNLVNNIMMPQEFAGYFQPGISQERAMELLDIVGLHDHGRGDAPACHRGTHGPCAVEAGVEGAIGPEPEHGELL